MFSDLIAVVNTHFVAPLFLLIGAYLVVALFRYHQWRGQSRREFFELWTGISEQDNVKLEVAIRHLTGEYMAASLIRYVSTLPGATTALFELAELNEWLAVDISTGKFQWRNPKHSKASNRRITIGVYLSAYFLSAITAYTAAELTVRGQHDQPFTWVCGLVAASFTLIAAAFLLQAVHFHSAHRAGPVWVNRLRDAFTTHG